MNGTQSQAARSIETIRNSAEAERELSFNFQPTQLNRFLKIFKAPITFTYGKRQVTAEVFEIKDIAGTDEVEIHCRDADLRYDVILNIKTRQAHVARVYPVKQAIKV